MEKRKEIGRRLLIDKDHAGKETEKGVDENKDRHRKRLWQRDQESVNLKFPNAGNWNFLWKVTGRSSLGSKNFLPDSGWGYGYRYYNRSVFYNPESETDNHNRNLSL